MSGEIVVGIDEPETENDRHLVTLRRQPQHPEKKHQPALTLVRASCTQAVLLWWCHTSPCLWRFSRIPAWCVLSTWLPSRAFLDGRAVLFRAFYADIPNLTTTCVHVSYAARTCAPFVFFNPPSTPRP